MNNLNSPTTATAAAAGSSTTIKREVCCCGEACTCSINCACTESLCRCEAASVLNSVGVSTTTAKTRTKTRRGGGGASHHARAGTTKPSCCSRTSSTSSPIITTTTTTTAAAAAPVTPTRPRPCCASSGATETSSNTNDPLVGGDDAEGGGGGQVGAASASASAPGGGGEEASASAATENNNNESENTNDDEQMMTRRAEFWIDGMTCTMCSQAIETAVKALTFDNGNSAGVRITSIAISLATDSAVVEWQEHQEPSTDANNNQNSSVVQIIQDEIEAIGYTVQQVLLLDEQPPPSSSQSSSLRPSIVQQQQPNTQCCRFTESEEEDDDEDDDDDDPEDPLLIREASPLQQQQPLLSTAPTTMQDRWQRLEQRQADKVAGRRRAFFASLLGALPIFILTMVIPHDIALLDKTFALHLRHVYHLQLRAVLLWALATPVQFLAGWEFYRRSFYALRGGRRQLGMDVLVALGTSASYGYAVYGVWTAQMEATHFFETSTILLCFILAGKWMQAAAVRRTSQALSQLMELQAKTAVKVTPFKDRSNFHPVKDPYGQVTLPIQDVQPGDIVKVIRGASIPADGTILYGEISVDESMVTGESMPVLKSPGSVVLGGTICVESSCVLLDSNGDNNSSHSSSRSPRGWAGYNQDDTSGNDSGDARDVGAAFIEVTATGADTALSQIVSMVMQAQTRAVPIQCFADQVAALFVPSVCAISVMTFLVWYALCYANVVPAAWYDSSSPMTFSLMFALAVLVISCPCALGLATPTAVMVGTGVSAKMGVLMKGGEALETSNKIDSLVFDKTGTLTVGKPAVSDFLRLDDQSKEQEEELLWLLGSLERSSEHPLAKAIVNYAEERFRGRMDIKPFGQPTQFRALTGRGASGIVGDVSVAVGNRAFSEVLGYDITFVAEECMVSLEEDGKTAILVFIDGTVSAILGIADEIKPDAAASIAYLRDRLGIDVWMVTGDNVRTASAVSNELGLPPERVIAEALPAAKLEQVRKLQAEGKVVAMIGDGCNDSPALAQADVGMSLGTGAEIANEASDVVLVKGHVADVCTALDLSRVIFSRIKWNLLWSLIYNCLGIPVAAGVAYPLIHARLPPTMAAMAMALSSISVVLSSLSLRLYRPPEMEPPPQERPRSSRSRSLMGRRRRPRPPPADQFEDSMGASLLENDHQAEGFEASEATVVTEATEPTDNRTFARMEEGETDIGGALSSRG